MNFLAPKLNSKISAFNIQSGKSTVYQGNYTPASRKAIQSLFYGFHGRGCEKQVFDTTLVVQLKPRPVQASNQCSDKIGSFKDLNKYIRASNAEFKNHLSVLPNLSKKISALNTHRMLLASEFMASALILTYGIRGIAQFIFGVPEQFLMGITGAVAYAAAHVWGEARSLTEKKPSDHLSDAVPFLVGLNAFPWVFASNLFLSIPAFVVVIHELGRMGAKKKLKAHKLLANITEKFNLHKAGNV